MNEPRKGENVPEPSKQAGSELTLPRQEALPCPRDSDLEQVGGIIQRTDAPPSESNRMRRGGHEHGLYY